MIVKHFRSPLPLFGNKIYSSFLGKLLFELNCWSWEDPRRLFVMIVCTAAIRSTFLSILCQSLQKFKCLWIKSFQTFQFQDIEPRRNRFHGTEIATNYSVSASILRISSMYFRYSKLKDFQKSIKYFINKAIVHFCFIQNMAISQPTTGHFKLCWLGI